MAEIPTTNPLSGSGDHFQPAEKPKLSESDERIQSATSESAQKKEELSKNLQAPINGDRDLQCPPHSTPPTYEDYKALVECLGRNFANRPFVDVLRIIPDRPLVYEKWQGLIQALQLKAQEEELKADSALSKMTEPLNISVDMMQALGVALKDNQQVARLVLTNCGLNDEHLSTLLPFLATSTVVRLDLTGNQIQLASTGLRQAVQVLNDDDFGMSLILDGNPLADIPRQG